MHIDLDHLETGPGGPGSVLVRAHGRVGEGGDETVVVRVEGRTYALVPVEDPGGPTATGPLVSGALVLPDSLVEALRLLAGAVAEEAPPATAEVPRTQEERDRRPAAADLAKLAEDAGLD